MLFGLRLMAVAVALTLSVAFLLSFKATRTYSDVWQQLGLSEKDAASHVQQSFINGYLQYAGVSKARHIAVGDRAAMTKDMLAFTKTYLQGEEFKKAYERLRTSRKPSEPEKPQTEEQIRKKNIDAMKEGIANVEKGMKTANAEMKKILQESLEVFQKQLKEYEDPNNALIKMMAQGEVQNYEYQTTAYKEDLKKWEKEYPADPAPFVKKRLEQMLDYTKDIDYDAQLTERNGKKYFAKAEYERKSSQWKMGFRAGREVTETARAYVQQWIKEL
jgi:pyruvate/2-oxoacid:ferredoxin oxidoreductase alpha subunit